MEPGFVPIEGPAKVVTVSLFPNESELSTPEFQAHRRSLAAWGRSGSLPDYATAYRDWVAMLPDVDFFRDFNRPVFEPLGIASNEFAWLPLINLPLPPGTTLSDDDFWDDDFWASVLLQLRPPVILAQGLQAHDRVQRLCQERFPHRVILQKIGRVGTAEYHSGEK